MKKERFMIRSYTNPKKVWFYPFACNAVEHLKNCPKDILYYLFHNDDGSFILCEVDKNELL